LTSAIDPRPKIRDVAVFAVVRQSRRSAVFC